MRALIETIAVAFSMFSALPMPQFPWKGENLRYALCAFPLVGLVIGLLCWVWHSLCWRLGLPPLVQGGGLCLLPVMITGGIHLDGYCDTCDALASHGNFEGKQAILKDPHIGAFGVIRLCGYFLTSFVLWTTLKQVSLWILLLSFCLSRSLSGLSVAVFPLARDSGLAYTFASSANRRAVAWALGLTAGILALCLFLTEGFAGGAAVLAAGLAFWRYWQVSQKYFGGLSGDLCGWFLQRAELWMLAALWLVQWIGGVSYDLCYRTSVFG